MKPRLTSSFAALALLWLLPCWRVRAQEVSPPATPVIATAPTSSPSAGEPYGAVATASRTASVRTPLAATVFTLEPPEILNSPNLTRDALLRSLPSASTFRRSTSFNADPSAQGLSLRGVAPSGVSRTLVLVDGVPMNDPFAGSIYHRALPRLGVERIEVVPGGGSALYGSSALSGVVQFLSRPSYPSSYAAEASYGRANTLSVAGYGAGGTRRVSGAVEGEWLSSDGFPVVAREDRGPIDDRAASLHGTASARGELKLSSRWRLGAGISFFREELRHATRYTNAAAQLGTASARARYTTQQSGTWDLTVFGRFAAFDQERARIIGERMDEARSARQHVPASDQGGSLVWTSPRPSSDSGHRVAIGLDARHVWGVSRERLFPAVPMEGSPLRRNAGGQQVLLGAFAEDRVRLHPALQLEGALRYDAFRNYAGERKITRVGGMAETTDFGARTYHALSPRLGVLVTPTPWLTLRSSAYRSFRAPTLNELYRPFQVGTVLTSANHRLRPEYLLGGELGSELRPSDVFSFRTTGFWYRLDDPIVNATLTAPLPDGSGRQRKNLARARVAGVELASITRITHHLSLTIGYTWVDARVTKQGDVPGLRGKRLAQDPSHRASALLAFDDPRRFTASLQVRVLGEQYEDDLNTLPMKRYAVVDLLLARRLFWQLELFAAVENLLNQSYLVGRAGVDTIGTPLLARAGLRIRMPEVP